MDSTPDGSWYTGVQRAVTLVPHVAFAAFVTFVLYVLGTAFYNIFLHPLRDYPGPLLWRMSRIPRDWHMFNGTLPFAVADAHKKHGTIIRTSPNELSYTEAEAWTDIWARKPGQPEWMKSVADITLPPNGYRDILSAERDTHARYRRLFAYAFSERGLREQEGAVVKYTDLLINRLGEIATSGETTEMVSWYNMSAFDVIGDLAFGASFDSLHNRQLHDWIPAILYAVRFSLMTSIVRRRGLQWMGLVPDQISAGREKNFIYAATKVQERIDLAGQRGDFWDRILIKSVDDNKAGEGMTHGEMLNNASVMVLGGSETSATLLSGVTFLLLKHQTVMKKLVAEIRTTFDADKDMSVLSVSQLKYLDAVLNEAMRLYPPVVIPAVRLAPQGGAIACGKHVPEGTRAMIDMLAMNRGPNFNRPDDFVPERWLDDAPAEFAGDKKAAFQPMTVGPRNCIGSNLARAEMRLTLAKVLWHFDLTLDGRTRDDWLNQRAWALWTKNPLYVKLSIAKR